MTDTTISASTGLAYQFNNVLTFIGAGDYFGLSRSGGDTVIAAGTDQLFSANQCASGNVLVDAGQNLAVCVMWNTNPLPIIGTANDPGFTVDLLPFQSATTAPDGNGGTDVLIGGSLAFDLIGNPVAPHFLGGMTT